MTDEALRARRTYASASLDEREAAPSPFEQFRRWFEAASAVDPYEAIAMTLATVRPDGAPAARTVLLRGFDERGFVFYTNYESAKGNELAGTPRVALLFYWPRVERQVRIEGAAERVGTAESDAYFASRPREHRLSAWASLQSRRVADRAELERAMDAAERTFAGRDVERPPHWGGFRVVPDRFEFWQGRPARLHDRIVYQRDGNAWTLSRLAP